MSQDTGDLDRFLESVQRRAFRMARFAVGNSEDALDVVQDAMTGLVKQYRDRNTEELKVLFYRILRNKITDWRRRSAVRRRFQTWFGIGDDSDEEAADPVTEMRDNHCRAPDELVLAVAAVSAVNAAVAALPIRQQQAFLFRVLEELSVSETAAVMGCSEGSVKTHYHRAVQTLRQKLGEYQP